MKKHRSTTVSAVAVVLGLVVLTGPANGASITVSNPSFESGTTGWTGLGGVHSFNEGLSPRPDGSANNAWFNAVTTGYQVLGTAVQANTTYTLTVDVGDRSTTGFPVDGTELRLGVGSTSGQNLLLLTGESRPVPTTGWQVWTATFESGPNPASGNLRIELRSGGSQPQFDNVRLDAVASSFNPTLPWNAFVRNYSFEEPNEANGTEGYAVYLWSSSSSAGKDRNGSTSYDPTPDTADGEQLMYSNGADAYQVLDSVYLDAANTYTLTVDVGDRTDTGFGGAELRMGTGSTYGNNLLTATVVSNTTPVNGVGASDGWQTWVSTFTPGAGVVGASLRIELVNPGGAQTLWDNVRLRVTPPVAGAISWTTPAGTNITATSAVVRADVTENTTETVLVWDTSDKNTNSIGAWAGSRSVGATNAGTVSVQATNLLADTLYTCRYYGSNAAGRAWSPAGTFSTALTAAQKPVFTSATIPVWDTVSLTWQDQAANETAYLLQRSTNGTDFALLVTLAANTTSYADGSISAAGTYTYRLAATNASNGSVTDFAACETNAATAPPAGYIFVPNHSFESPDAANGQSFTPASWTCTGDLGWDINGLSDHDPTPDADGEQIVMSNGGDWYIALGTNLEAYTTYTLTVDVGDRTGLDFGGAELRMGTGATYGNNLLTATVVSNTTPVNGAGASDGWKTWVSTFTAGSGVVGDPLRIELVNPGGIQTLWDNVRLTKAPVPPRGTVFKFR